MCELNTNVRFGITVETYLTPLKCPEDAVIEQSHGRLTTGETKELCLYWFGTMSSTPSVLNSKSFTPKCFHSKLGKSKSKIIPSVKINHRWKGIKSGVKTKAASWPQEGELKGKALKRVPITIWDHLNTVSLLIVSKMKSPSSPGVHSITLLTGCINWD